MISVCIPTYNGAKYIKEQLESILVQLGPEDEVIISDDRSTDETLVIVASLQDSRVKIYTHEKVNNPNKGTYTNVFYVCKNVENALLCATGNYIFLSDQDDIWLPNKIDRVMQEFERGAECVLHNNTVIDKDCQVISDSYFQWSKPSKNWLKFILMCPYQGACMAFTREIKEASFPFPRKYPISHDHWIACNSTPHISRVVFIVEPLMLYRRHGNNVSPSAEKSKNSLWFKISYRFNLLFHYIEARTRR